MKNMFILLSTLLFFTMMSGCASKNLKTPCPDFGRYCYKIPVNSWNHSA